MNTEEFTPKTVQDLKTIISKHYDESKHKNNLFISVMNGVVEFGIDFIEKIENTVQLDLMKDVDYIPNSILVSEFLTVSHHFDNTDMFTVYSPITDKFQLITDISFDGKTILLNV